MYSEKGIIAFINNLLKNCIIERNFKDVNSHDVQRGIKPSDDDTL